MTTLIYKLIVQVAWWDQQVAISVSQSALRCRLTDLTQLICFAVGDLIQLVVIWLYSYKVKSKVSEFPFENR